MKTIDKILYLQKLVGLNDSSFSSRYKIKKLSFKLWKLNKKDPKKEDLTYLTESFNLDIDDFMDDSSTLADEPLTNEHRCKNKMNHIEDKNLIYEDFAREDNSRYEEKD